MTSKPILTAISAVAALVVSIWPAGGSTAPESVPAAPPEAVETAEEAVDPARVRQADELMAWGVQRYAENGLELPEIDLVVHPSLATCGGRVGRYDERTNELWLCRIDTETVLHELAHAWIDHNMDGAERAAFVELRGVAEWNDREQPWADRGSEQAAEILVWALSDHDRTVRWVEDGVETRRLLSIDGSSPEELQAGYRLMTGGAAQRRAAAAPAATPFSPEAGR